MTPRPVYEHDCDKCTFLGRVGRYDIYTCPQGGMRTIVARFGGDGPDYTSGATVALFDLDLRISFLEDM